MTIFYSASTVGFYDSAVHGDQVPDDVVEVSPEAHRALLTDQAAGKIITADATGHPEAVDPPPPTLADAAAALTVAVQAWLDATACGNGYDSIASCVSYRGSSVAQWDADAVAALAWRDAVWQAAFQWQQDALANPPSTFPTSQEVIAELPQPEAFGWVVHAPGADA